MPRIEPLLAGALALLAASPAYGGCTLTTTAVAFGAYDTLSPANDDSTGTIRADCDRGDRDPVASINGGSSGSIAARTLRNGAILLNYNLYTTAARNIIWGNGTAGSTVALTFLSQGGGVRRYQSTVYGRIPPLQPVVAGGYNDTVTVTITF
jgi:spore coat protein U-like protein